MQYWVVTSWHHCGEGICIPGVEIFPEDERDAAFACFAQNIRDFITTEDGEDDPEYWAQITEIPVNTDTSLRIDFDNDDVESMHIGLVTGGKSQ